MNPQKLSSLSVFFPAYNEEGNIVLAIQQALAVLPNVAEKFEIIVVNDGSKDKTKEFALGIAEKHSQVRVVTQRNKGYGGALKRGFAESKYEWVFFTDADLQFDLSELKRLVSSASSSDLVLGYRTRRADGWKRIMLAFLLKIWNRIWFHFPQDVKDVDCAFKLIKRQVVKTIEPFFSDGAMISTELILKARAEGFVWNQVGVTHFKRLSGNPTGSNWRVIWRAVQDTWSLRCHFWLKSTWAFSFNSGKLD